MKVAIYARVSTANNGQDPTMQTRELREFARAGVGTSPVGTWTWDGPQFCRHVTSRTYSAPWVIGPTKCGTGVAVLPLKPLD